LSYIVCRLALLLPRRQKERGVRGVPNNFGRALSFPPFHGGCRYRRTDYRTTSSTQQNQLCCQHIYSRSKRINLQGSCGGGGTAPWEGGTKVKTLGFICFALGGVGDKNATVGALGPTPEPLTRSLARPVLVASTCCASRTRSVSFKKENARPRLHFFLHISPTHPFQSTKCFIAHVLLPRRCVRA
jgi:hypothetical protein